MNALSLVRAVLRPEHLSLLDDALAHWPATADGHLDPRVFGHLIDHGALSLGDLVEAASDAPVEPKPPTPVDGVARLALLAKLGAGAMGQVFLVEDTVLHRHVALKLLDPSLAADPGMRKRFHHEVQITAQLDHPSIVAVHDMDEADDGTLSYTMKLVRGRTLQAVIDDAAAYHKRRQLPPEGLDLESRLNIFLDVCDAMAYAHTRGIIHRDLKPENIMVGAFHQVLVMDWGIARVIGGVEAIPASELRSDTAHKTEIGTAIGTPAYMSPEQARGENDALTGASDQYTLGLILQELVTLQRARQGNTSVHTLYLAMEGERATVQPRQRPTNVPKELVAIIDKAAHPEVSRRYRTVADLADDIRRYLRDEPVLARPDTPTQAVGRWISRHRTTTLAVVLALLLTVVGIALLAVAGAVAVNEYNRIVALDRQEKLTDVQHQVTDQGMAISDALLKVEGLLRGAAGSIETALASEPPSVQVYQVADFEDPERAPADLTASKVYDGPVSIEFPDIVLAPGVDARQVGATIRQLASTAPALRRALVDSMDADGRKLGPKALAKRLRDRPSPVIWSYAATSTGVSVGYPGTGFYPDDYDARKRPWFEVAIGADQPVWSALDADESGLGLLLTCSMALRDPDGRSVGVAAVDLTFGHVIDALLDPPDLASVPGVEAWLIDENGKVIVRTSQKSLAREVAVEHWAPPDFPYPELLADMKQAGGRGVLERPLDGTPSLAVWRPIPRVGWTYLVTGPVEGLL